jgi:hypothetical protein
LIKNKNHFFVLVSFLFILSIYTFRFSIISKYQVSEILEFIPDDAFYYIKISQNKAEIDIWSFDGINISSGFHFLMANIYKFLFQFKNDISFIEIFRFISMMSILCISSSYLILAKLFSKNLKKNIQFFLIPPFLSYSVLIQTTFLMESSLVIFFTAASFYFIFQNSNLKKINLYIFIIAVLGTMSRSDFGLINFCIFFASLFYNQKDVILIRKKSLVSLIGSISGHVFLFSYNYLLFDNIFQKSSEVKFYWSEFYNHSILSIINLLYEFILPFVKIPKNDRLFLEPFSTMKSSLANIGLQNFILIATLLILFLISIYINLKNWNLFLSTEKVIILSCLLTVFSYILFYKFNSGGIQPWYISNFLIPLSILILYLIKNLNPKISTIFLIFFIMNISVSIKNFTDPVWEHHSSTYEYSKILDIALQNEVIGTWNAGIIGYFSENNLIINIDGLINDTAADFVLQGNLIEYILRSEISYLSDYEFMFKDNRIMQRGGYLDDKFNKCTDFYFEFQIEKQWKESNPIIKVIDKLCYENP